MNWREILGDMPKLGYTAAQIRAAEAPLLARNVPLMQRASAALADHVLSLLPTPKTARVTVLAGAGDNGGDALYAAAELARAGVSVEIVAAMGKLPAAASEAALAAGAQLLADPASPSAAATSAAAADVVVDGVLGIGSGGVASGGSPALRGNAREVVASVKAAIGNDPLVVAVDIPSGIDPDSGEVSEPDAVLAAHLTVTFIGIKAGLLQGDGPSYAGKIWLEPIGASQELLGGTPAVTAD